MHVQTVNLTSVTLPSAGVGMVIAQPFITLTEVEPFRCADEVKPQQLKMVRDTLAVSLAAKHGAKITHFTVFPEYSIPGCEGIALIDDALAQADWPSNTIVIGGTDALSKDEFSALAGSPSTILDAEHNGLESIAQNEWINCCITWVKDGDGRVVRWLQPKISPAWPEADANYQRMYRGASVFMFEASLEGGTPVRFCSLVCFDWIAKVGNKKVWQWVLSDLEQRAINLNADSLALTWCFVIQYNQKPSHTTFLTEVGGFFDQTEMPRVLRDQTCLVFANCAGRHEPGQVEKFGNSALLFSPQTLFVKPDCYPTYSNGGERYRSNTLLNPYKDMLFRERGACVHSFFQVNPKSVKAGADGRTIALQRPYAFPLNECQDPRVPSEQVPACIKWLNDELDTVPSLSSHSALVALAVASDVTHRNTVISFRAVTPQFAVRAIQLASSSFANTKVKDADAWDHFEVAALEHLVHTIDILDIALTSPMLSEDSAHATITLGGEKIDLMAIRGTSHDKCIEHAKQFLPQTRRCILLISRDHENNPWDKRFGNFLQAGRLQIGQERNITDTASGFMHLGYRTLLDIFQLSTTPESAKEKIYDSLVA